MVTIVLQESVVAQLSAQAAIRGLSLEDYLADLSRNPSADHVEPLSGAQIERLLNEASVPGPAGAGTYRRAEIYRDHD